jgi:hypothetical protein
VMTESLRALFVAPGEGDRLVFNGDRAPHEGDCEGYSRASDGVRVQLSSRCVSSAAHPSRLSTYWKAPAASTSAVKS